MRDKQKTVQLLVMPPQKWTLKSYLKDDMKEKTVKLLKLKIEKFIWLLSSLFWIIMAIVALNKQRPLIAIVFVIIGIAIWKGEVKERWKNLSEAEDFVRNNWE
jgi:hypothetical protein